jgi:hypothetical protein
MWSFGYGCGTGNFSIVLSSMLIKSWTLRAAKKIYLVSSEFRVTLY